MGVTIIIPLIEANLLDDGLVRDINDLSSKYNVREIVLVKEIGGILPCNASLINPSITIKKIESPKQGGNTGALKRGLFAATEDILITIEHKSIHLKAVLENATFANSADYVLGVFQSQPKATLYECLSMSILGKGLIDGHCGFRIITKLKLNPILGRIYLDKNGFNTEWAYIAKKLNMRPKVIAIDGPTDLPQPSFKTYFNLLRLRLWHFPVINTRDLYMSDKDVAEMYANECHHWWFVAKAAFMKKILNCWVPKGNHMILDAGCGTGHNMRFLADQGNYVGIDVSKQALNFCQTNGHTKLAQANLEQLPFKDKSFDVIFSLDVVEHTQNPWVVIRQLKRVLKDNGHVIIAVPASRLLFSQHDEALSHYRRYDAKDLKVLLEEAGFEITHLNHLYFSTFFPVAIIRVFRKIFSNHCHPSTDMYYLPARWINALMSKVLAFEVFLLDKLPLPVGTTVIAVGRKK